MTELIYIQHHAGTFENGIQVCIFCGHVLCNYDKNWKSVVGDHVNSIPEGKVYICTHNNSTTLITIRPDENYGPRDQYRRKVVKCV